mmetsp:Transcript_7129/g.15448  ORF Transcript_7129/g.15448 Transcript_7129/m.15448 type:complete len:149 (-) Transcript_7129:3185-3631(-)
MREKILFIILQITWVRKCYNSRLPQGNLSWSWYRSVNRVYALVLCLTHSALQKAEHANVALTLTPSSPLPFFLHLCADFFFTQLHFFNFPFLFLNLQDLSLSQEGALTGTLVGAEVIGVTVTGALVIGAAVGDVHPSFVSCSFVMHAI